MIDVTKWASLYYSYQKGLTPPGFAEVRANGTSLPPEITTNNEIGIKADLFNNRLSVTTDYFRYNSTNAALIDFLNPGFYVTGPGKKNEGFEISSSGKIGSTRVIGLSRYIPPRNIR